MAYECPKCGSGDHLNVVITVWASLHQGPDENLETMIDGRTPGDHEWGNESPMNCLCTWRGVAQDALVERLMISRKERDHLLLGLSCIESELPEHSSLLNKLTNL